MRIIGILLRVGFGSRIWIHVEACELYHQKRPHRLPISRATVTKLIAKYTENGSVEDLSS